MNHKTLFIDIEYCIGCRACEMACKQEHNVPVGTKRIDVIQVGPRMVEDKLKMDFVPIRCRHCAKAPCIDACPEEAMKKRSDGIVLIDSNLCIGCLACAEACPFGAVQLNTTTQVAEKCTLCAQRIDRGLEPACVSACPSRCIYFGESNDPMKVVSEKAARRLVEAQYSLA